MRCLREEDGSKRQTFGTPRHRFGERRYQRRAFGNAPACPFCPFCPVCQTFGKPTPPPAGLQAFDGVAKRLACALPSVSSSRRGSEIKHATPVSGDGAVEGEIRRVADEQPLA